MHRVEELIKLFKEKPYLIGMGANLVASRYNITPEEVKFAKRVYRKLETLLPINTNLNVLIIGDTHLPYEKLGYLEFCIAQYHKFQCNRVIHIGDLIDSHSTSRHPFLPEAYAPGHELDLVIKKLKSWYKAFPNMLVVLGNHDRRINKIASESMITSKWIKGYAEVLEVPNWDFLESYEIGDTLFIHGTGSSGNTAAIKRAIFLGRNVVMGHLHSEAGIQYHKLRDKTIWGMIVGCGVNEDSYGMYYAKNFPKKSIISCGVILNNQPLIIVKP